MIAAGANSVFFHPLFSQDSDFAASEGGVWGTFEGNDAQKETHSVAVWNLYVFNSSASALPQGFSNLI